MGSQLGVPRLGAAPLNSTPGGLVRQRCDPYGAETRVRLLGGLYPESHRGRHMWHCDRESAGTFRMVCACLHRGQPMPLCGPGLVRGADGSYFAHPGHITEIRRRQAGLCPKCAWPPEALPHFEAGQHYERELRAAIMTANREAQAKIKLAMEDTGRALDELAARGIVHRCPLVLREVS